MKSQVSSASKISQLWKHILMLISCSRRVREAIRSLWRSTIPAITLSPCWLPSSQIGRCICGRHWGIAPTHSMVCFPEEGFEHARILMMLVPKPKTLDQAFAGDPSFLAFGPREADKAETGDVIACPVICLLPKHLPATLVNPYFFISRHLQKT